MGGILGVVTHAERINRKKELEPQMNTDEHG